MADKPDPLGPPDPNDPFYVPPDYPRWNEADVPPAPENPPPGTCPHCATVLLTTAKSAQPDEAAICSHCLNLSIAMGDGIWRRATYDEAEAWDRDPRVIAMRAIWTKPPEPEG